MLQRIACLLSLLVMAGLLSGCFVTRALWEPDHHPTYTYRIPVTTEHAVFHADDTSVSVTVRRPHGTETGMVVDGQPLTAEDPDPRIADPHLEPLLARIPLSWRMRHRDASPLPALAAEGLRPQVVSATTCLVLAPGTSASDAPQVVESSYEGHLEWYFPMALRHAADGAAEVPVVAVKGEAAERVQRSVAEALLGVVRVHQATLISWRPSPTAPYATSWAGLSPLANLWRGSLEAWPLPVEAELLIKVEKTADPSKEGLDPGYYSVDLWRLYSADLRGDSPPQFRMSEVDTQTSFTGGLDITDRTTAQIQVQTSRRQYDTGKTIGRVALTPLAVAGDTIIIVTSPIWVSFLLCSFL